MDFVIFPLPIVLLLMLVQTRTMSGRTDLTGDETWRITPFFTKTLCMSPLHDNGSSFDPPPKPEKASRKAIEKDHSKSMHGGHNHEIAINPT